MTAYPLTDVERAEVDRIVGRIAEHGGLFRCDGYDRPVTDHTGAPEPLDYEILHSRRYLVDPTGTVWRFFGEGSSKDPASPHGGGAPWRNNRVEMWNGRWRKSVRPDGGYDWKKVLVAAPVEKRINGHPGMTQIDWYRTAKGYAHPLEGPDRPEFAGTHDDATKGTDDDGTGAKHRGTNGKRAHSTDQAGNEPQRDAGTADSKTARTHRRQG